MGRRAELYGGLEYGSVDLPPSSGERQFLQETEKLRGGTKLKGGIFLLQAPVQREHHIRKGERQHWPALSIPWS